MNKKYSSGNSTSSNNTDQQDSNTVNGYLQFHKVLNEDLQK